MTARNSYVFHEEDEDAELFKDLPEDYNDFDVELEEDDLIISSDLLERQAKFKKLSVRYIYTILDILILFLMLNKLNELI